MDQQEILSRITAMVEDEKALRARITDGATDGTAERERLTALERELDRCWDLLRQRRAKAEFGENPDEATPRPATQVENYRN
ncbi:DUF2630 family protein [Streptomyces sp. MST-110588]|uniref:DUF2630 family protein n=1 Tax=Streptomyces sp. MST-110588 TaxID=2833628 RepID=UPI001F5C9913|nr:DUF2630 family protein [Streptomyces sp. MST-110588]UNO43046.1 DUF2630 family protein [Streptomyces sp. MST-110588]